MNIHASAPGVWFTIAAYIALMAVIGIVTGRKAKSVADITVGGRKAGAWLSALSYGTAYFSAVMFVGYAGGTGLKYGLWGISAGIGNAVFGSWLAWKMLARKTRDVSHRLKIKTMPQYFFYRYGSNSMKLFSCIVIFIFLIPYSASVYKGLASVADVLLGIDVTICLVIIAAVAALLLILGGYLVQARADFAQGIIMMFGVALLIFFVIRSNAVGGFSGIAEYAKTERGLPKLGFDAALGLIATVLMTSFGTWGLPQMIQKYFGIKDDEQAKRGIKISTFFALLVAGGGYFIGSLCHRFFTADNMPAQDYIVPMMLKEVSLPSILLGVVIVLLLAASVSTLCSITLTASSTVSIDFVKGIKKDMSDKNIRILTKVLCVLFIALSYVVANTDTPILDMMSYSWGIISGSFLAPYVLALYYKKLTKGGAWCAIIGGFSLAVIPAACKIATLFGVTNANVVDLAARGPVFACAAMIFSIILCLVGSAVFKNKKDDENSEFFYNAIVENE
ncbi:MAG: sodium:solute symporter family protein [Clostridiales bacterium]|jgi:SSS family solute:Na+ symporter/sodium/proline symporter|nr:sodium:solute symporter family protein [Clostridiales bacterium]